MKTAAPTVLFVDDDRYILNSLMRALRSEPYRMFFAEGGQAAIDLLETEDVSVIVTDLGMPEINGFDLIKRINTRHPDIINIVLSAFSDTGSVLNAIKQGAIYRYIIKPWDINEFKTTITQAIDLFTLHQEKRDLLVELEENNRLLEKRVLQRTKQLVAAEKKAEIGKYASQIVHNINNPLTVISGAADLCSQLFKNKSPDWKKLNKFIGIIRQSVIDLEKITRSILDHTRNNSLDKTELVDVNEIIKKELDFFKLNSFFQYKIEKKINFSDNLPLVFGSNIQIKQLVDNLLKNAIDAMEHSGRKQLGVSTALKSRFIEIQISDTGEGIAEKDLPRIFSSDFTTKPPGRGTGLGLASVKTMVEAYAGKINVETAKGKGAKFIVKLPATFSPGLNT